MIIGKIFKYGNDINTDVIFPGKYTYTVSDYEEMAKYAMEDLDADFVKTVEPGDVIVAGKNFGCGSSREQAVICLKYSKVGAIIAESFSRIYFRNCINQGIPAITLPKDIIATISSGDTISVDLEKGEVEVNGARHAFPPYSPEIQAIMAKGGIIPYTQEKLQQGV